MRDSRGDGKNMSETVSRVLYLTVIYLGALSPIRSSHLREATGPVCMLPPTVLLRIEFTATSGSPSSGALLPRLSTLTPSDNPRPINSYGTERRRTRIFYAFYKIKIAFFYTRLRRYISVALFLKSPSAGVTRYPCPVEPGLSSWTAFRRIHATVCLLTFSPRDLSYRNFKILSTGFITR